MRYPASEKLEIIRTVERSHLSVRRTLDKLGIPKTTFYRWYDLYQAFGATGLEDRTTGPGRVWNRIPDKVRRQVVTLALDEPELSPRELAVRFTDTKGYFVSEASVYRLLKAQDLITSPAFVVIKASSEFKDKTTAPNQLWQTDFTYFKIKGWGWYYLSTILDDYSRYIVTWKLCKTMKRQDVEETINQAYREHHIPREGRPRLLSDNGSCYIATDLKTFIRKMGMSHVRGAANHPQTQGKIERYHRSMKSVILLDNYPTPERLERRIAEWVEYYNNHRYHESLRNLTPADVYFGREEQRLKERAKIKRRTMAERRRVYQQQKEAS